jgi:hypothetical protein
MHSRLILLGFIALACGGAACSSNHAATAVTSCGLRAGDSVFAAAGPVFRDCAVDKKANLTTTNIRPDPSAFASASGPVNGQCYSVELEFVVGEHGAPELGTARVVRSNDPSFADAWLKTLATWRYEPAIRAGKPVRQIVDERRTAATQVMLVPKGSPPPGPPRERTPNC